MPRPRKSVQPWHMLVGMTVQFPFIVISANRIYSLLNSTYMRFFPPVSVEKRKKGPSRYKNFDQMRRLFMGKGSRDFCRESRAKTELLGTKHYCITNAAPSLIGRKGLDTAVRTAKARYIGGTGRSLYTPFGPSFLASLSQPQLDRTRPCSTLTCSAFPSAHKHTFPYTHKCLLQRSSARACVCVYDTLLADQLIHELATNPLRFHRLNIVVTFQILSANCWTPTCVYLQSNTTHLLEVTTVPLRLLSIN